jgi:exodeoxyribonuclease VII large subunit
MLQATVASASGICHHGAKNWLTNPMSDTSAPVSNALEWSVSDLSGALKRAIEDQFGFVRVRGEISGYRGPSASGHVYFSLKDAGAKIDAVIWKGQFGRLKTKPQEGLEVIATGRVTTFPGKSSYQVIIDGLEPAGLGALMALLEERRRKLAAEGLFAAERKRPLPYLPRVIGVVTSPTGAVIRDILHRLEDRFPRHVLVWPVRVQGETSGAEVAAAIRGFNALTPGGAIPRPDVLIVARGGGSLEDLMSFNEEAVVRAAAASDIPLISAVGHETDWTLIDHAADVRAPTPTAAAEMAVPVRADLLAASDDLGARLARGLRRGLELRRSAFRAAARALPAPDALFAPARQRLDLATTRLPAMLARNARSAEQRLQRIGERLQRQSPAARLARLGERLSGLSARLLAGRQSLLRAEGKRLAGERQRLSDLQARARRAMLVGLERRRQRLAAREGLLASLGYKAVLRRGYALLRDEAGKPVRAAGDLQPGQRLRAELADGEAPLVVEGETAMPSRPSKPSARVSAKASATGQPGLFDEG